MFPKSAAIFKIADPAKLAALTEERLAEYAYAPIEGYGAISQGFSEIDGVRAYRYMDHILMHLTVQKKAVPASAVKARVKEVAAKMHEDNGHAPGRKVLKEIKERVIDELMARAIPSTKTSPIFIDVKAGRIVTEASNAVAQMVMRLLYQAGDIEFVTFKLPGRAQMAEWFGDDGDGACSAVPDGLTIDDSVVFEHPGEGGKTVKYERSNLSDEDVQANLEAGAEVLSLALTYDSKISFVLADGKLSRIKALGVLAEKPPAHKEDAFQNAFYLAANEMAELATFLNEVA